jgi:hypothetical protein
MPAAPLFAQHRDKAGDRASESKQDMKSDDGQKERGRGRNGDTCNDSLAISHLTRPRESLMAMYA